MVLLCVIRLLAARPYRTARRTKIAAILADHRVITALAAQLAGGGLDGGAAGCRGFEDAHLL